MTRKKKKKKLKQYKILPYYPRLTFESLKWIEGLQLMYMFKQK